MKPPLKQPSSKSKARSAESAVTAEGVFDPGQLPSGPTGRYLVVLRNIGQKSLVKSLKNTAGLNAVSSADFEGAVVTEKDVSKADALIFEHIGVAVVDADPNQISSIESAVPDNTSPILAIEPEEWVHALDEQYQSLLSAAGMDYLRGYQDAIAGLIAGLSGAAPAALQAQPGVAATYTDTADLTWGLQATRAADSLCTGRGINVAVLDTGFDLNHPDFAGRSPITASFVPGVPTVQDGHGHGTHCIGTACGPRSPAGTARRYGVATDAVILAGKVLNDQGSGADSWILAGINWAIQNEAVVISMSLGAPVAVGGTFKVAYEQAAQAAMGAGCIIVAAAGNDYGAPVGSPANCPSIMAVAAVDSSLQRANFSNLGINPTGGEVNIAGPGVAVYSSWKMPTRYNTISGTSMATPHVAGCAALWAEKIHPVRGGDIWDALLNSARDIGLPAQQVGYGLVQAGCLPPISLPWKPRPIEHRPPISWPFWPLRR